MKHRMLVWLSNNYDDGNVHKINSVNGIHYYDKYTV